MVVHLRTRRQVLHEGQEFTTNGGTLGHTPSDFRKALKGAEISPILSVLYEEGVQQTDEEIVKEWMALIG